MQTTYGRGHREGSTTRSLNQYFTPRWAAEAIVERHCHGLHDGAVFVEPSCGDGSFLMAIPERFHAIGVEIDPVHAQLARANSGRHVIDGDFLSVELPMGVDWVIGNPPFVAATIAAFLDRSHQLLREGGQCGLLIPSYVLQAATTVNRFTSKWSVSTEMLPRNLFPGLSLPITFTVFKKDHERKLFGLFLYKEAAELAALKEDARQLLNRSTKKGSVWRQVVHSAFDRIGEDVASLSDIYGAVQARPTANPNWEHQIRKILQTYDEFAPAERGFWMRLASNDATRRVAA